MAVSPRNGVKIALAALAAVGALAIAVVASRSPRSDRAWDTEFARTAVAMPRGDGTVALRNVRDFTYGDGALLTEGWIDEIAVNPRDIVRMWFILEPFAEWKAVGHTFLSFELKDGSAYAFSIEARREKGERYSAFGGLFRNYELTYSWGTERDFITRRLLYLKHPVRMYPLAVAPERAQGLFKSLLQKTNELAIAPRFYNTLTANCTNMLAKLVNQAGPGSVPYDLSWYLPGYSDLFLMRVGLIGDAGTPDVAQHDYDLTVKRDAVIAIADAPHAQFGTALRQLLPSPRKTALGSGTPAAQ